MIAYEDAPKHMGGEGQCVMSNSISAFGQGVFAGRYSPWGVAIPDP